MQCVRISVSTSRSCASPRKRMLTRNRNVLLAASSPTRMRRRQVRPTSCKLMVVVTRISAHGRPICTFLRLFEVRVTDYRCLLLLLFLPRLNQSNCYLHLVLNCLASMVVIPICGSHGVRIILLCGVPRLISGFSMHHLSLRGRPLVGSNLFSVVLLVQPGAISVSYCRHVLVAISIRF